MRFIRAEPPCWKGEIQIGRVVFVWEVGLLRSSGRDTREMKIQE